MKHFVTVATVSCTCKHEQQDKMYGANRRLANRVTKANVPQGQAMVKCTVCSKTHTVSEGNMR